MSLKCKCFLRSTIIFLLILAVRTAFEFQNIKCTSLDPSFVDFEYCFLKSINRSYKYASVKAKLFKVPVTNVTVGLEVQKKANGYRPFLYKVSFDACKILKKSSQINNVMVNYVLTILKDRSNVVHPCPFDHDVIVDRLDIGYLDNHLTRILPIPKGEYAFLTNWTLYNKLSAIVNAYGRIY